jgi:microcystin-dependent protein
MNTTYLKPSIAVAATIAGASLMAVAPAYACDDQPYLGMVCMTAATYCPRGYAEANGQLMSISQYSALYALMGTTYGGDGRSSFALPDLRGRSGIGLGQGPGLSPVTQGQTRGSETTTLTIANMPSHSHPASAVNADGASLATADTWPANPKSIERGATALNAYAPSGATVTLNSGVVGATGGNTPFNSVPPQLGMRYCVAIEGIFPPRN